jgi:membrane protein implicated in regulation of membrane protease activity
MGTLYWAALIVGLGTILLQLAMSGHGDGEVDAGADADVDDADVDADAHADTHGWHAEASGFLPIFLSLRFWTFAALGFGMVGAGMQGFRLTSAVVTFVVALSMGLASGLAAAWTFRALRRAQTTSGASVTDLVGQTARVLVPPGPEGRCKVRVQLLGQTLDLMATSDERDLGEGDTVIVVAVDGETAHVSFMSDALSGPSEE